jgi:hypothetical protein
MAAEYRVRFYRPERLTAEVVRNVLGLVSIKVSPNAVARWTDLERLLAYDFAWRCYLKAGDHENVQLRPCPEFIRSREPS